MRDDEHDADQRRKRDLCDQRRQEQNEQQDHDAARDAGKARTAAGAQVDHGLADHGTAAHAAKQTGDNIGGAEGDAFTVRLAPRSRYLIGEIERQQRFKQADHGHQGCVGQDDLQRFQAQWHSGKMQDRQATGHMRQVTQGAGRQVQTVTEQPDTENGDERRRHRFGETRQHIDDGHRQRDQAAHDQQRRSLQPLLALRRCMPKVLQLRHRNDNGQSVHETQHHWMRHHADQLAQAKQAKKGHQDTAENNRRQQILHAMPGDECHDHHRHRTGGAGNHAGSAAEDSRHRADDEGAVQPHQRVDLGDQGKGDALGHQRERRCQAGEHVFLYVREPFFPIGIT